MRLKCLTKFRDGTVNVILLAEFDRSFGSQKELAGFITASVEFSGRIGRVVARRRFVAGEDCGDSTCRSIQIESATAEPQAENIGNGRRCVHPPSR